MSTPLQSKIPVVNPRTSSGRKRDNKNRTTSGQLWNQNKLDLLQLFQCHAPAWRDELVRRLESKNKKFLTAAEDRQFRRLRDPEPNSNGRLWIRNAEKFLRMFQDAWNETSQKEEKELLLSWELFAQGPPTHLPMSIDLAEGPPVSVASTKYLRRYLMDLKRQIAAAHRPPGHVIHERDLRQALAITLEVLQSWKDAAEELRQLADIHSRLRDFVAQADALMRMGIALYRHEKFSDAEQALVQARDVIESHVDGRAVRTQVKIRDFLGLCFVRLNRPKEAIDLFDEPTHMARFTALAIPLADASRSVRKAIALLQLREPKRSREECINGVETRLEFGALPEAARALRYIGLAYFEERRFVEALIVWETCLYVQRAYSGIVEEAKLSLYLGRTFIALHQRNIPAVDPNSLISKGLTEREERSLQILMAKMGPRSRIGRPHEINEYLRLAAARLGEGQEISQQRGLHHLHEDVMRAIESLNEYQRGFERTFSSHSKGGGKARRRSAKR